MNSSPPTAAAAAAETTADVTAAVTAALTNAATREAIKAQIRLQILAQEAAQAAAQKSQSKPTTIISSPITKPTTITEPETTEPETTEPEPPTNAVDVPVVGGPWACDQCDVTLTSEAQLTEHLQGMKHHAKEPKGFFCDVCNIDMSGEKQLSDHMQGKKHRSKAAGAAAGTKPLTEVEPVDEKPNDDTEMGTNDGEEVKKVAGVKRKAEDVEPGKMFYCAVCQVSMNSAEMLESHQKGKKHKAKAAFTGGSVFDCGLCGVQCSGQAALDSHRIGKKHKAMVEKSQKEHNVAVKAEAQNGAVEAEPTSTKSPALEAPSTE